MVNLCTIFIDDFFGFGSLFRNTSQLNYRSNNGSNHGVFCPTWSEAARLEVTNEQRFSMRESTTGVPHCFLVVQFHLHAIVNLKSARYPCDCAT